MGILEIYFKDEASSPDLVAVVIIQRFTKRRVFQNEITTKEIFSNRIKGQRKIVQRSENVQMTLNKGDNTIHDDRVRKPGKDDKCR